MKCIACGEENVQNARFCAFCGAKLSEGTPSPVTEEAPAPTEPAESIQQTANTAADQTARPLSENPYQPPRPFIIPSASAPASAPTPASEEEESHEAAAPRQIIKPAPKRMFLFDEEEEEEAERPAVRKRVQVGGRDVYADDEDEFEEYDEYDDDEEDIYDEEGTVSAGQIFVRVFSVLTVLILIAALLSFAYGTSIGRRLRASFGMSGSAADYVLLADWQLSQGNAADASASYYNAFKLDTDNYDLSLTVGTGFENSGDTLRAEQLYSFMITEYPQADEPYDRLMALLIRQGRTAEYESLLQYRAERQPGFTPPLSSESAAPAAPVPAP